ncbi:hypothetical protein MTR67_021308 [Solanum verrucosum]|uniref:Uncharacterized protein n=1 Tax=Solanum verrucosum TaxID=315347 RepID=A0AAF0TWP9_SOLVR|nr:uncharacterized protein LOC125829707 [Solanum verrucosum]WMV27923.1 hypothetical protein MTR67_021308 [Solanum verrucosum]
MNTSTTENGGSLWSEIIESTRTIFKSHVRHFHAISILFLLPIIFSLILYPSFELAIFYPDYDFTSYAQLQFPQVFAISSFEIILLVVYALFLAFFFICGVGTTTYSAVQVIYDRPINVVSSIKSMRNSFFPLLSTFIVSQTIFISITLLFALILVFVVRILQSLGLIELKSDLDRVLFLVIFSLIVLVPILIWLQVNWSLAYVITVVESKKGYETLRRSAKLVKGERCVALKILMYYESAIALMVVWCAMFLARGEQWRSFTGILLTAFTSVMGYILMNQYLVANVVLYMHCKELNDEKLMSETAAGEYVSLSVEEEEKNHDVV